MKMASINNCLDELPDCPLCMEPFGLDDIYFFPCACRYQVCRFCWHRIRTDENGLCPHCREPYTENPAEYTPLTQEQMSRLKSQKRQKSTEKKQKLMESRKSLADVRVIQKNLVFVVGLSPRLADPETLRKNEYFGKYGRIFKVVINNHTVYNGTQGPSVSAYVTFHREDDALKAISAVNNAYIDGRYLKASFGTTKYCTTFLRGSQCTKPDCMYLHALGDDEASFTKEDMHQGKHQVYEQSALAAANLEPTADSTVLGSTVVKKVKGHVVSESGEVSALPSTASWASSGAKPEALVQHSSHKGRSGKQRSVQNHSPKSHTLSSSPRSSLSKLKHNKSNSKSGSSSPNTNTLDWASSAVRRTNSINSASSRDSSKTGTPNLSPKSNLSKSVSCGSLNQDPETVELPNCPPEPAPRELLLTDPQPLALVEQELALEAEQKLQVSESGGDGVYSLELPGAQYKVVPQTDPRGTRGDDVLNVLTGLSSTGSGFGSLGVSWNSQVPSTLMSPTPDPPAEATPTQHDDDLGFDPWDVSQQGLADLLETEAEEQRKPQSLSNGVGEHTSFSSHKADPWQDEFRALFPDVNISFGGGPGFPSSAHKTDSPSSYHPTQLASALNSSYNPNSSSPVFNSRGFPASSTKVTSDPSLPAKPLADWGSFTDTAAEKTETSQLKDQTPVTSAVATPPLPSPPPGFVAKPTTASTRAMLPKTTPTTVSSGATAGTLNTSVNHALWGSQVQGHIVPNNHILQSWNNFLNISALSPAQQQQLARNSQNYQHLLTQQYLLIQNYLMRGYPMLQAQAQAQAQIQATVRAQLQQHALRQQQGTPPVQTGKSLPPTSVVSTIASVKEPTTSTVQTLPTAHNPQPSKPTASQPPKQTLKQPAKNGTNVKSKSKAVKTVSSERKARHKPTGKQ